MTDQWPRGTKRARQACSNCRRKKTRCPGERPICGFCQRLKQPCNYDEDIPSGDSPPVSYNALATVNNAGDLAARLSQIEYKLNKLSRTQSTPSESFSFQDLSQTFMMPSMTSSYPAEPPMLSNFPFDYNAGSQTDAMFPGLELRSATGVIDLPNDSVDRLIGDYFRYSHNQPYSFFHEETFRRKVANGTMPDYLLQAVFASSLRFSTDSYFEDNLFFTNKRKLTADIFASNSWKILSSRFVDGDDDCDVGVVQAVTLLAIYEFVEGRQRKAWVKIGIAAKFAQDLRLMYEPASSLPFSEQEESRRAFWSIYLLDKLMTCGRARPPVFTDGNVLVQLPCAETAFLQNQWEETDEVEAYLTNRVPQCSQPSPFSRVIIISAILSRCSQYAIQARHDSHSLPPWDVDSKYTSINSSLTYLESHVSWHQPVRESMNSFKGGMDSGLSSVEQAVVSQALHHLCYCILNHYFLLRQMLSSTTTRLPVSFVINALQSGLYHAKEFNRVLKSALEAGCKTVSSFLSYACLFCATIHAVYRHADNRAVRDQAIKDLKFALSFLQRQARYWPNSGIMVLQLNDFCQHALVYKPLIDDFYEPVSIPAVDTNRIYTLIDYSILSSRKDVAIWTSNSPEDPLWLDTIAEPS